MINRGLKAAGMLRASPKESIDRALWSQHGSPHNLTCRGRRQEVLGCVPRDPESECYWMQICGPNTQWNPTNLTWVGSRERLIAGWCKETDGLCTPAPRNPKFLKGFSKLFKRKVVTNFLVQESFVLAAIHISQITTFLQTSNRTDVILWSVTFYLYKWKSVLSPWKLRALRMGSPVYSGNILKVKKSNRLQKLAYYKSSRTNTGSDLFFPLK